MPEIIWRQLDMATYKGGAHPAELVATDAAGLTSKKQWTINVDPKGSIGVGEAEDTVEAVEETNEENLIDPAQGAEPYLGMVPGVGLKASSQSMIATGAAVPTVIPTEPSAEVEMLILPGGSSEGPCWPESLTPEEDAERGESVPDPEHSHLPETSCPDESVDGFSLEPITVDPLSTAGGATSTAIVNGTAAISANTVSHVDTVKRPLYEGLLEFKLIRDASATQSYEWEVDLEAGQEIRLADPQHAEVFYEDGHLAFAIAAIPASDAVGTNVPTELSVSEDRVVSLMVKHQSAAFVYPVVAGSGWQGGYFTTVVNGPKDEKELREERERREQEEREALEAEEEGGEGTVIRVLQRDKYGEILVKFEGPPVAVASASGVDDGIKKYTFAKAFNVHTCYYDAPPAPTPELQRQQLISEAITECKNRYGWRRLQAKLSVHGWYRGNTKIETVWILKGNLHCDKWGHSVPAMVNCEKSPAFPVSKAAKIYLHGDYRFWPGDGPAYDQPPGGAGTSACVTLRGSIQYGVGVDEDDPLVQPARQGDTCPWPDFPIY